MKMVDTDQQIRDKLTEIRGIFDGLSRIYYYPDPQSRNRIHGDPHLNNMDLYVSGFDELDALMTRNPNLQPYDNDLVVIARSALKTMACLRFFAIGARTNNDERLLNDCINHSRTVLRGINSINQKLSTSHTNLPDLTSMILQLRVAIHEVIDECTQYAGEMRARAQAAGGQGAGAGQGGDTGGEDGGDGGDGGAGSDDDRVLEEGPMDYVIYLIYDATLKKSFVDTLPKEKWVNTGRCRKVGQGRARRGEEFRYPPAGQTGLMASDFIGPRGVFRRKPVEYIAIGVKVHDQKSALFSKPKYVWEFFEFERVPHELQDNVKRTAFRMHIMDSIDKFREERIYLDSVHSRLEGTPRSKVDAINELLDGRLTKKRLEEFKNYHVDLHTLVHQTNAGQQLLPQRNYDLQRFTNAIDDLAGTQTAAITRIEDTLRKVITHLQQKEKFLTEVKSDRKPRVRLEGFQQIEAQFSRNPDIVELIGYLKEADNQTKILLGVYDELVRQGVITP